MILLIQMPTQGTVSVQTMKALIGLTQALRDRGIAFAIKTYEWSDLVISRNYLMSWFLGQGKFTHSLLLDSDVSFAPDLFFRMADFGADFTVAPYPQRSLRPDALRAALAREQATPGATPVPLQKLIARTLRYNIQAEANPKSAFTPKQRDGFRTVAGAGTGVMLVSRRVPERLVAAGAARHFPRFKTLPGFQGVDIHDFFSHLPDPEGNYLYAEDQSFCRRWVVECGEDIWAIDDAQVVHHGSFDYPGDYLDFLAHSGD